MEEKFEFNGFECFLKEFQSILVAFTHQDIK